LIEAVKNPTSTLKESVGAGRVTVNTHCIDRIFCAQYEKTPFFIPNSAFDHQNKTIIPLESYPRIEDQELLGVRLNLFQAPERREQLLLKLLPC